MTVMNPVFNASVPTFLAQFKNKIKPQKLPEKVNDPSLITFDPDAVASMLGDELAKMSIQERETTYEEIHGVDQPVDETPDFVEQALNQMETELQSITKKPGYTLAEGTDKEYVEDTKFRISFLRAEKFDPAKSAARMVMFMDEKLKYFGPSALCRPIQLSDLTEDDIKSLKAGGVQSLPCRDRAGRAIVTFNIMEYSVYTTPRNFMRAAVYLLMTMCEDDENQRQGVVSVTHAYGNVVSKITDSELSHGIPSLFDWIPLRLNGVHAGLDDPMLKRVLPIIIFAMGYERRKKQRCCFGSITEYHYNLMTFGIPVEWLPVTQDNELKTKEHMKYITRRLAKEMAVHHGDTSIDSMIDVPGVNDVLLGKGKPIQNHPGNIRLRKLVIEHLEKYHGTPKGLRNQVAEQLVVTLQGHPKYPCRFLKRSNSDGWWVEASDDEAQLKVFKIFRSIKVSKPTNGDKKLPVVVAPLGKDQTATKRLRIEGCLEAPCFGAFGNSGKPDSKFYA